MSTTLARAAETGARFRELAEDCRAWPFEEARKLAARIEKSGKTDPVLFETGYGPSGLPHIGTFGEVARTTMVRHAFDVLTEGRYPSRLLSFSDDMDGMRKVPENVPNRDLLARHLGKPLTKVPDPFGTHESFGHHNNAMLRSFLDAFGFDYEFASATEYYARGLLDEKLLVMLERYDDVMAIMLPTLREERQKTYSPFLPVHPETGVVMQVPVEEVHPRAGTIVWTDPDTGSRFETPVTGGHAKAQWKPDWALRWAALGVDYEMSGKDHIDNMKTSSKICRVLGGMPPDGFNYELFLDENGEKISKSKGNGLTIEEWLRYASQESLALFMYQRPREAKKLHWDVIPRHVDEYFQLLSGYDRQDEKQRLSNPVWHIHSGNPPEIEMPVSFALLLNLVSASNAHTRDVLWGFIGRYAPGVTPQSHPHLDAEVGYAIRYYEDHVAPTKTYRAPDEVEREALLGLDEALARLPEGADAAHIQDAMLDVARPIERYQDQKKKGPDGGPGVSGAWFNMLYEVLLGQSRGPRFGSFVALYGIENTRELIRRALAGELAATQS
ncbi:lysine--tRNA ligase [Lutibaculum baratangense]|uniref:Lysine--tRNA ligase n=1 Tax=Lutibaculum baratangense AMV1 TaxID=631454 RepID=V4R2G1_9HYPH|nr:lysine--tRNA ligase [Lutibaculum baratangense]ESR26142.1 Lysyl-tRNA synthetase (class I) [Lutibaculum baratangense AMV1]